MSGKRLHAVQIGFALCPSWLAHVAYDDKSPAARQYDADPQAIGDQLPNALSKFPLRHLAVRRHRVAFSHCISTVRRPDDMVISWHLRWSCWWAGVSLASSKNDLRGRDDDFYFGHCSRRKISLHRSLHLNRMVPASAISTLSF